MQQDDLRQEILRETRLVTVLRFTDDEVESDAEARDGDRSISGSQATGSGMRNINVKKPKPK